QVRQIVVPQKARAQSNGVGVVTQRKLDKLARTHPEQLERVRRNEVSVHRAMLDAGLAEPSFSVPEDPAKLATRLIKRLSLPALQRLAGLLLVEIQTRAPSPETKLRRLSEVPSEPPRRHSMGPRDMLQPGSVEWCYRTLDLLKIRYERKALTDK